MSEPQKITQLFGDDDVDACDGALSDGPSFDDATPPHNQSLVDSTSAHEQTPSPSDLVNVNDAKEEKETVEAARGEDVEEMEERDKDEREKRKRTRSLSSGSKKGRRNKEQSPVPYKKDKPVAETFKSVHHLKLVDLLKKDCCGGFMRSIKRERYETISNLPPAMLVGRLYFVAEDDGERDFEKVDVVLVIDGSARFVHFYTQQKKQGGGEVEPDEVLFVVEWVNEKLFGELKEASRRLNDDHSAILDKPIISPASVEGTGFLVQKLYEGDRQRKGGLYSRKDERRWAALKAAYTKKAEEDECR